MACFPQISHIWELFFSFFSLFSPSFSSSLYFSTAVCFLNFFPPWGFELFCQKTSVWALLGLAGWCRWYTSSVLPTHGLTPSPSSLPVPSRCLPFPSFFLFLHPHRLVFHRLPLSSPPPPNADLLYPLFISQLSLHLYPPLSAFFPSASFTPPHPLHLPSNPLRPSLLGTQYLLSPSLAACVYYLLGTEAGETGRTSPREDFHSAVRHWILKRCFGKLIVSRPFSVFFHLLQFHLLLPVTWSSRDLWIKGVRGGWIVRVDHLRLWTGGYASVASYPNESPS